MFSFNFYILPWIPLYISYIFQQFLLYTSKIKLVFHPLNHKLQYMRYEKLYFVDMCSKNKKIASLMQIFVSI